MLKKGFTLIELLIVVIIMTIVAVIVIPQFNNNSITAKESALDANLRVVRSAIEMYKVQHNGIYPGANSANSSTCPSTDSNNSDSNGDSNVNNNSGTAGAGTVEAFIAQLTKPSNDKGETCPFADSNFKFGPYLKTGIPAEPMTESKNIAIKGDGEAIVPTTNAPGWAYDYKSGQFVANSNVRDSSGVRRYFEH